MSLGNEQINLLIQGVSAASAIASNDPQAMGNLLGNLAGGVLCFGVPIGGNSSTQPDGYKDFDLSEIPRDSSTMLVVLDTENPTKNAALRSRAELWSREGSKYINASSFEEVSHILDTSYQDNSFTNFVFMGEGKPGTIICGKEELSIDGIRVFELVKLGKIESADSFYSSLATHLRENGSIYFISCNTGSGSIGTHFMLNVSNSTGVKVFAPTGKIWSFTSGGDELIGPYMFENWKVVYPKTSPREGAYAQN